MTRIHLHTFEYDMKCGFVTGGRCWICLPRSHEHWWWLWKIGSSPSQCDHKFPDTLVDRVTWGIEEHFWLCCETERNTLSLITSNGNEQIIETTTATLWEILNVLGWLGSWILCKYPRSCFNKPKFSPSCFLIVTSERYFCTSWNNSIAVAVIPLCKVRTFFWDKMTVRKFSHVSKKTSKQKFKKTYIWKQVRYLEYYSDPRKLNLGVFL